MLKRPVTRQYRVRIYGFTPLPPPLVGHPGDETRTSESSYRRSVMVVEFCLSLPFCYWVIFFYVAVRTNRIVDFPQRAPREGSARPQRDRAIAMTSRIAGRTRHLLGSAAS